MIRVAWAITAIAGVWVPAQDVPEAIPTKDFARLQAMIRPYPGEYAWRDEITYFTRLQEAREKAAAEGKPLLLWAAADGHPLTQS